MNMVKVTSLIFFWKLSILKMIYFISFLEFTLVDFIHFISRYIAFPIIYFRDQIYFLCLTNVIA